MLATLASRARAQVRVLDTPLLILVPAKEVRKAESDGLGVWVAATHMETWKVLLAPGPGAWPRPTHDSHGTNGSKRAFSDSVMLFFKLKKKEREKGRKKERKKPREVEPQAQLMMISMKPTQSSLPVSFQLTL